MKNKRWLILSHAFNMDGRAASQTITDKIPYLLEAGIEPIVLSAVTGVKDDCFPHYQLLPWGPSGLRFDFRHWFAKNYGRGILYKIVTSFLSIVLLPFIFIERIFIGLSSQSSWAIPAFIRSYCLIRQGKVDLVFSSAGAWSAHYAAWLLKKTTNVPWIAEVHDPMVIRYDQEDDGISPRKNRDKRFLQKLEAKICKDADHVWWFTEGALAYAKHRNPSLGEKGFVVLPGATPPSIDGNHQYTKKLHICHFGSLANDRSLAPLFRVLSTFSWETPKQEGVLWLMCTELLWMTILKRLSWLFPFKTRFRYSVDWSMTLRLVYLVVRELCKKCMRQMYFFYFRVTMNGVPNTYHLNGMNTFGLSDQFLR